MFECRACVLRYIRAIAGDSIPAQHLTRRRLLAPQPSYLPTRRRVSTVVASKNGAKDTLLPGKQPVEEATAAIEKPSKQRVLTIPDEKNLKVELRYLGDRVKLAEHVHYTLRCQKPEKALNLCRLTSKQDQVIVSWNHCIDWHMSQNKIDDAIKIYNEMKKRAQFPDSFTYSLLLRGLAKGHHHGQIIKDSNVSKAVSIYNSMSSPTSRVKPTILHTNAVLRVCSAALDMDALWGIASKLPTNGPGAPDRVTYSILLNAIRHGAFGKNPESLLVEQTESRRHQAIQEGRRIWQQIIPKWRAGEIHIDEELVCAMGRLLLISRRMQDRDDVLNLVRQTMNIERQIAPLGSEERRIEHVPEDQDLPEPEPETEDSEGYMNAPSTKAFNVVTPLPRDSSKSKRPGSLSWVQPGNPTLSLVIDACKFMWTPKTAVAYWELLTQTHGVKPDLANFHAQLKLLGKNRASAKAAALLNEGMPAAGVEPKFQTFRLAMSVCARDKNNRNVLDHAWSIIEVMQKTSADLDIHTLIQYVGIALSTEDGAKISTMLEQVQPIEADLYDKIIPTANSASHAKFSSVDSSTGEEAVHFFQALTGAIDTLINRALVPKESFPQWQARKNQLNAYISQAKTDLGMYHPRAESARSERQMRPAKTYGTRDSNEEPGRPMQMSKTEWALKVLKHKEKTRVWREKNRQRAIALKNWDVGQSATGRARGSGFADTPLELGMK